ncbi:MAG: hypothetical protein VW600_05585 [Ferrovibrio sp.]
MVNSIGSGTSSASPQAATAPARVKTVAEQKLDAVLASLKASSGVSGADQARRQIGQARVKLAGLMLAAGSAAAMGNGRMAKNVADDIRSIARDLGRTFTNAASKPVIPKALADAAAQADAPQTAAQSAATQIKASLGYGPNSAAAIPAGDLDQLKADAGEVVDALRKVMKKLQFAGMNPLLDNRDRISMQSMFGDANRELASLQKALKPGAGDKLNFTA